MQFLSRFLQVFLRMVLVCNSSHYDLYKDDRAKPRLVDWPKQSFSTLGRQKLCGSGTLAPTMFSFLVVTSRMAKKDGDDLTVVD